MDYDGRYYQCCLIGDKVYVATYNNNTYREVTTRKQCPQCHCLIQKKSYSREDFEIIEVCEARDNYLLVPEEIRNEVISAVLPVLIKRHQALHCQNGCLEEGHDLWTYNVSIEEAYDDFLRNSQHRCGRKLRKGEVLPPSHL